MSLSAYVMTAVTDLQQRGIQPAFSRVIEKIGAAIWKVALENWCADERERSFAFHVQAALTEFQAGLHHFPD